LRSIRHFVPNGAGWHLGLTQRYDPAVLDPSRPPIVIIPGYGMNSFIFGFHPTGVSLAGHLVARGFEVWTADLRAQGSSVPITPKALRGPTIEELALVDVPAVIEGVLERSRTPAEKLIVLGASLGGTLALAHAALSPEPRIAALVTMGSPLRWTTVHPLVKIAFASPALAGLVPLWGTRKLAGAALPMLAERSPALISMYLNAALTDTSRAKEMVETVEDPSRALNKELAHWIRKKDLYLRGTNITDAVRTLDFPLLVIAAHGDGVVPRDTAAFPYWHIHAPKKELVFAGDETHPLAHADLFVSREAVPRVFEPLAAWLHSL